MRTLAEALDAKLQSARSEFSDYYQDRFAVSKSVADSQLRHFTPEGDMEETAWEAGYLAALESCYALIETTS